MSVDLFLAQSCPKFERCNAAFCPAAGGSHMAGEPACLYMREAVKHGGEARVRATLTKELADRVVETAATLLPRRGPLARALRDASRTGSSIEKGQRLNATGATA